jgi:hypothetical protein
MAEDDPFRDAADALGLYFVGDTTMGDALTKVCQAALDAVEPATRAGISMTVNGRIGTYVFSHPEVQAIDQPQYDTGDGPCLDAFRTGQTTAIRSTLDPGPYPDFRRVAADHGLLSVLSTPLDAGSETVVALNLYAPVVDAFDERMAVNARILARHAAYLLLNHQAYWDARTLSENLKQAMESRAEIEQAKGIIMAAVGCSADEAFKRLREQSQHQNVKVRDLATELVRNAQRAIG